MLQGFASPERLCTTLLGLRAQAEVLLAAEALPGGGRTALLGTPQMLRVVRRAGTAMRAARRATDASAALRANEAAEAAAIASPLDARIGVSITTAREEDDEGGAAEAERRRRRLREEEEEEQQHTRLLLAEVVALLAPAVAPGSADGALALEAMLAPLPPPAALPVAEAAAEQVLQQQLRAALAVEAPHLDASDPFVEKAAQLHAAAAPPGAAVVLLGEPGSGKTTLRVLVARLLAHTHDAATAAAVAAAASREPPPRRGSAAALLAAQAAAKGGGNTIGASVAKAPAFPRSSWRGSAASAHLDSFGGVGGGGGNFGGGGGGRAAGGAAPGAAATAAAQEGGFAQLTVYPGALTADQLFGCLVRRGGGGGGDGRGAQRNGSNDASGGGGVATAATTAGGDGDGDESETDLPPSEREAARRSVAVDPGEQYRRRRRGVVRDQSAVAAHSAAMAHAAPLESGEATDEWRDGLLATLLRGLQQGGRHGGGGADSLDGEQAQQAEEEEGGGAAASAPPSRAASRAASRAGSGRASPVAGGSGGTGGERESPQRNAAAAAAAVAAVRAAPLWMVFDGDVGSQLCEALRGIAGPGSSRRLFLEDGERLRVPARLRLLLEMGDAAHATPALLSQVMIPLPPPPFMRHASSVAPLPLHATLPPLPLLMPSLTAHSPRRLTSSPTLHRPPLAVRGGARAAHRRRLALARARLGRRRGALPARLQARAAEVVRRRRRGRHVADAKGGPAPREPHT